MAKDEPATLQLIAAMLSRSGASVVRADRREEGARKGCGATGQERASRPVGASGNYSRWAIASRSPTSSFSVADIIPRAKSLTGSPGISFHCPFSQTIGNEYMISWSMP